MGTAIQWKYQEVRTVYRLHKIYTSVLLNVSNSLQTDWCVGISIYSILFGNKLVWSLLYRGICII